MKITPMEVTLLDSMGTDLTVVNAARVSFDKESDWKRMSDGGDPHLFEKDAKLIDYLAKHNHWTPFGHCFVQFRIKAPIFVARQLVKHQVGLVWNEVSRRYVDAEPEFWFPDEWRGRPEGSMKQGSGKEIIKYTTFHDDNGDGAEYRTGDIVQRITSYALRLYTDLITSGVAPEQARMVLPLNTHTEWYWSGSLAAWARVCKLRLDPHAQVETGIIAKMIAEEMELMFPVSWSALMG